VADRDDCGEAMNGAIWYAMRKDILIYILHPTPLDLEGTIHTASGYFLPVPSSWKL
jgi:hypothetical protein